MIAAVTTHDFPALPSPLKVTENTSLDVLMMARGNGLRGKRSM